MTTNNRTTTVYRTFVFVAIVMAAVVNLAGTVAAESVDAVPGARCRIVADNNESVYPGTQLRVMTGSETIVRDDVEAAPDTITVVRFVAAGPFTVDVVPGPTGYTSLEYTYGCRPPRTPPPVTIPPDLPPEHPHTGPSQTAMFVTGGLVLLATGIWAAAWSREQRLRGNDLRGYGV